VPRHETGVDRIAPEPLGEIQMVADRDGATAFRESELIQIA
jgi:hypothetical protein